MAVPPFVAVETAVQNSLVSTWTLTVPTHSTGDRLIAALFLTAVSGSPPAVTTPAGWTAKKVVECDNRSIAILERIASASEPASYDFLLDIPGAGSQLMASYSGVDAIEADISEEPPDLNPSCIVASAHEVPGITTTVDDVLVLTFTLGSSGGSWTPDAGTTERADINAAGSSADGHLAEFAQASAGATGTKTHTYSNGTSKYIAIMMGLMPITAFDRILPLSWRTNIFFDRVLPLSWRLSTAIDRALALAWRHCVIIGAGGGSGLGQMDVGTSTLGGGGGGVIELCQIIFNRVMPLSWRGSLNIDRVVSLAWTLPRLVVNRVLALSWLLKHSIDRVLPASWSGTKAWTKEADSQADAFSTDAASEADAWTKDEDSEGDIWS